MGIYVEEGHGQCHSCGSRYMLNEITLSKNELVFKLCKDCSETLSFLLEPEEEDDYY